MVKYVLMLVYSALCIWLTASFGDVDSTGWLTSHAILLFLCVLPLFNSPLDWLSLGFTRGLLHYIFDRHHGYVGLLLWGILDAIIAIFFLFAVSSTTVLGIWLMGSVTVLAGGEQLFDLNVLLEQMHNGEWREKIWIWLLFGSTLLPTAVHFIAAMLALAFYSGHEKAEIMAVRLQADRVRAVKANKKRGTQEAAVVTSDMDARLFAFYRIYLYPYILFAVSLSVVAAVSVFFFSFLPTWMEFVLKFLVGFTPLTGLENIG